MPEIWKKKVEILQKKRFSLFVAVEKSVYQWKLKGGKPPLELKKYIKYLLTNEDPLVNT